MRSRSPSSSLITRLAILLAPLMLGACVVAPPVARPGVDYGQVGPGFYGSGGYYDDGYDGYPQPYGTPYAYGAPQYGPSYADPYDYGYYDSPGYYSAPNLYLQYQYFSGGGHHHHDRYWSDAYRQSAPRSPDRGNRWRYDRNRSGHDGGGRSWSGRSDRDDSSHGNRGVLGKVTRSLLGGGRGGDGGKSASDSGGGKSSGHNWSDRLRRD